MGKELASPYVSDNPQDLQKSIYSIAASQERRAQISSYISDFKGSKLENKSGIFHADSSFISITTSELAKTSNIKIPIYNLGNESFEIESVNISSDCIETLILNPIVQPDEKTYLNLIIRIDNNKSKNKY